MIVGLTALAIVVLQFTSVEADFRAYLVAPIILLMLLVLGIRVLFFSGMPWLKRGKILLAGIVGLVLIGVAIGTFTRREGSYSGAGVPRMVWRWTPHRSIAPLSLTPGIATTQSAAGPDDFPQFLGPQRNNEVIGVHLSRDWNTNPPKMLWHRTVGADGPASPSLATPPSPWNNAASSNPPSATTCKPASRSGFTPTRRSFTITKEATARAVRPRFDSGRVYVVGGVGNIDCLDLASGKVIWSRSLLADPAKQLHALRANLLAADCG